MYMQMTIVATKAAPSATRRPPGLRGESWKTPCRASPVEAHCRSEYLKGAGRERGGSEEVTQSGFTAHQSTCRGRRERRGQRSLSAAPHLSHADYSVPQIRRSVHGAPPSHFTPPVPAPHISHLPYLLHISCRPGRSACPPAAPPGLPQGYSSSMMTRATTTVAPKVSSHTPVSNGCMGGAGSVGRRVRKRGGRSRRRRGATLWSQTVHGQ